MAWSLNAIDLGQIDSEVYSKQANLLQITTPSEDDDENETYDFSGVLGNIRVSGSKGFDSVASAKSFVDSLTALVSGEQERVTYASDIIGSRFVMINELTVTYDTASPLLIKYEFVLFPANENSISVNGV